MAMDELWEAILAHVRPRVNHQVFQAWFEPAQISRLERDRLVVEVPNRYFKELLGGRYLSLLEEAAASALGRVVRIQFEVTPNREVSALLPETGSGVRVPIGEDPGRILNPKYTFGRFVVGRSNQFAHAAAVAVAERPGQAYNPLFIYGGVGLGKTHLMHSIGHHILATNRDCRLVYISAEGFTNEVVVGIREDRMLDFRQRYRNIDVLLIDDIQFIAGKESTQTEFFHTFNALYEARKQIVVSSDKFPKDMAGLEERLKSRFEWGLVADIQPPSLETKVAILQKKPEIDGIDLPNDVAYFIAERIQSNIRELEGCLTRVGAYASLMRSPVTIDLARAILKNMINRDEVALSIGQIQEAVVAYFSLKLSDMRSKSRAHRVSLPRQIAMYLCRELTEASLPEIGKHFGGRDHSTIIYAHKRIAAAVQRDPAVRKATEEIRRMLLG